jgi:hypothetical protein
MQRQVSAELIAISIFSILQAIHDVYFGRGFFAEISCYHGRELFQSLENRKVHFRKKIARKYKLTVPVNHKLFHHAHGVRLRFKW